MIGANNYGFAAIVERCVTNWIDVAVVVEELLQRRLRHDLALHRRAPGARRPTNVRDALLRVRAGDDATPATRPRSTRSSPRPTGRRSRAAAASATRRRGWTRQSIGGCGTWNRDADWANDTVVDGDEQHDRATRVAAVAASPNLVRCSTSQNSLVGRRLCETGVGVLEETGIASWQSAGAVDRSEWVDQIRTTTHDHRAVPAAGGRPRELLGPAGDAQLPAARLQRRRGPRRHVRARRPTGSTRRASRSWGCSRRPAAMEYGAHLPLVDFGGTPHDLGTLVDLHEGRRRGQASTPFRWQRPPGVLGGRGSTD